MSLLPLPAPALLALSLLVLCGGTALVVRAAARRAGGTASAIGLDRPRWRDLPRAVGWLAAAYAVSVVLVLTVYALGGAPGRNVGDLADSPAWALVAFVVLSVVVAPLVEETLFRGLLLRGLMTRLGFWPAALATSGLFGVMHAPTALGGAPAVVLQTAGLGLVLCLATRHAGRLWPAVLTHALFNGVAVTGTLLLAG
nr:CPBP family intramembrane glutamic endopeptidase [Motilibacter aurantiacus]